MYKCYYRHLSPKFKKLVEKIQEYKSSCFLVSLHFTGVWPIQGGKCTSYHWENQLFLLKKSNWRTNVAVYSLVSFFPQKTLQIQWQTSRSGYKESWWSLYEQHVDLSVLPQLTFQIHKSHHFHDINTHRLLVGDVREGHVELLKKNAPLM